MALIKFSAPPTLAGLFFCLASTQCRAFLFARQRISYTHAFTAAFLTSMQFIPQQRQNRLQGFTAAFPLILPIPAHTMQQPHKQTIHRLRHVGGHTLKRSTFTDTRYHRHAGRCISQHSRPIIIYNNVYKGVPVRPVMD